MANPIISVDGAAILCPSTYEYSLSDISESDAGRTEDTVMDKQRIGQCVTLKLAWTYLSTSELSAILQAFQPEYINVTYLDGLHGAYLTSEFYVGDRTAPLYNAKIDLWEKLSFNIIERDGRKDDV